MFKKLFFLAFFFTVVITISLAQDRSRIYVLGGVDFSYNSYSYARHKKVLRTYDHQDKYVIQDLSFALQYRYSQLLSFEAGIQGIAFVNQCLDTNYLARNPQSALLNMNSSNVFTPAMSKLSFNIGYNSYYFTATKYYPLGKDLFFYTSLGLTDNYLQKESSKGGVNTFYDSRNNETLQLVYKDINHYYGAAGEAGLNFLIWKERLTMYAGFRYNTGFKKVITGNYTDTQNSTIINTDRVTTNGTYMGLVLRAGINLFSPSKPHISAPHISVPNINMYRYSLKARKLEKRHKRKMKAPKVSTPRFIIQ